MDVVLSKKIMDEVVVKDQREEPSAERMHDKEFSGRKQSAPASGEEDGGFSLAASMKIL